MAENKMGSLVKQTAIYGLSSIIGRFLNYLMVPLYTYHMAASSGGYGVVTNIYSYVAFLMVLLTFGMETTFFRFANKQGVDADRAFSTSVKSVGLVALLFFAIVSVFLSPISSALKYKVHPEYVEIMSIVVAIDAFQSILFARLRYENRAIKFMVLKLLFIFLSVGLNLFVFLLAPKLQTLLPGIMRWYHAENQVRYIFVINLICTTVINLGFIPELKKIQRGFDLALLRQMLDYTWPLLLLGLAGILNQVADKILYTLIVPGLEGTVQLGIYGACTKIAMIMALITQAFRYAYEPFVFGEDRKEAENPNNPHGRVIQGKVMKYFVLFTLFAFVAVMMYLDVLKYLIKSDYWEGLKVVPIVMMAEIFMGIYFNLSFWYKLTDKTWWGAVLSAIGCMVLIAINLAFVPKYGYMACAWGGFAGYGICMLLSYFIGQRNYKVPYDLKSALGYFVLSIAIVAVSRLMKSQYLALTLVINTVLLLVFAAAVAYFEREMVKAIQQSVRKILKRK